MSNVTYITSNPKKAQYFAEIIGWDIAHQSLDVPEIQSLSLSEIVEAKARAAYEQLKSPVIVEDTKLVINSLGQLPGPFIKWFEKSLGPEKICRLADLSKDRSALAGAAFAYYDGVEVRIFAGELAGSIPQHPMGPGGFGWNQIFIPDGASTSLAQMDDASFKEFYIQFKPFARIRGFLTGLDKG